ncbi:hypothetical protein AYO44_00960 [Planctomycetaceae bacterium SCGC AG-212-F19]|nr:hypothetical protein AYO44_00960 [Planctomycetaceae bacterium SCGC AG-212-F19]
MNHCGLRIADWGLGKSRLLAGGLCLGLLLCVALLAPAPAQDKDQDKKAKPTAAKDKDEPPPLAPRVVGTVLFPPRTDLQRISSADELFAVAVPNPHAGPGAKPTVSANEMAAKALDHIRKSQHADDGSWGDKQWPQNAGVTALCCLALFAEGSLPRQGPSGTQLARGLEFLLNNCKEDGQIVARDVYTHGPMYDHSWATLCLLQAHGNMPWRRDLRDKISRAIQLLLKYQHVDGGWRYKMMREGNSDTLVTLNVLYALRLAVRSGFSVPAETVDRAVAFIKARALKDGDRFNGRWEYLPGGQPGSATVSACGAIALYMVARDPNDFKDPRILATIEYLDSFHKRHTVPDLLEMSYAHYGSFYISQAMYVAGNDYWHPYYKKMLEVFAASQKADGQFEDQAGNSVYPTAAAAIVLQAPRGYWPLYLR